MTLSTNFTLILIIVAKKVSPKNLPSCTFYSKETSILKNEMVVKKMIHVKLNPPRLHPPPPSKKNKNKVFSMTCRLRLMSILSKFWLTNISFSPTGVLYYIKSIINKLFSILESLKSALC